MKFKYQKVSLSDPFSSKSFILRPMIPVSLRFGKSVVRYEALLDSGADFSIFPLEIAKKLGINLTKNRKIYFSGFNEEAIEGIISKIVLEIGGVKIDTQVVFSGVSSKALLGQYGFFDKFIVKFDLKKEEIEIKSK